VGFNSVFILFSLFLMGIRSHHFKRFEFIPQQLQHITN
jgi:hypothetical protein